MTGDQPPALRRGRLWLGGALLALSLLPYLAVPVVPFVVSSPARAAAAVGGVVVFAECVGALAVAVLGGEAWRGLRRRLGRRRD